MVRTVTPVFRHQLSKHHTKMDTRMTWGNQKNKILFDNLLSFTENCHHQGEIDTLVKKFIAQLSKEQRDHGKVEAEDSSGQNGQPLLAWLLRTNKIANCQTKEPEFN